ncbi:MAG: FoF1 ATP synthase subunit gamma [Gammaproteobacteria bacterium]|jgi:F-type H+-transporting ATPase subunit gamma
MTRRRALEERRDSLAEIRDILDSMKTLAYMETRKLTRFLDAQHAVVQGIEAAALDLLDFYPGLLPRPHSPSALCLLVGSERGFCGDFNHALLDYLESTTHAHPAGGPLLIAIGRKLRTLLEHDARVVAMLDGASVVEEVTAVINRAVDEFAAVQEKHGGPSLACLYHSGQNDLVMQPLLPPFQGLVHRATRYSHPPVLNRPPGEVLIDLTDHYLPAALHRMLYTSLLVENRQRVAHLEGAVQHLDDQSAELVRQGNALRQEEIIEELEMILLNTSGDTTPLC